MIVSNVPYFYLDQQNGHVYIKSIGRIFFRRHPLIVSFPFYEYEKNVCTVSKTVNREN